MMVSLKPSALSRFFPFLRCVVFLVMSSVIIVGARAQSLSASPAGQVAEAPEQDESIDAILHDLPERLGGGLRDNVQVNPEDSIAVEMDEAIVRVMSLMSVADWDEAEAVCLTLVDIAKKNRRDDLLGGAHLTIGHYYRSVNAYAKSRLAFQEALKVYTRRKDYLDAANAVFQISIVDIYLDDYDSSIKHMDAARKVYDRLGEAVTALAVTRSIANMENGRGDRIAALRVVEDGIRRAKAINDATMHAQLLIDKASIHMVLAQNDATRRTYLAAIEFSEREGLALHLAMATHMLGRFYLDMEDVIEAIPYLARAADLYGSVGDRANEAQAMGDHGMALRQVGNTEEALVVLKRALKLSSDLGDGGGVAHARNSMGLIYIMQDKMIEANAVLRLALEYYSQTADVTQHALVLANLSTARRGLGHPEDALKLGREAVELADSIGDRGTQSHALVQIGRALVDLKRFDEAEAALLEAENAASLTSSGHKIAQVYQAYVDLYAASGDKHLETIASRELARTYRSLGISDDTASKYREACQVGYNAQDSDQLEKSTREFMEWIETRKLEFVDETESAAYLDLLANESLAYRYLGLVNVLREDLIEARKMFLKGVEIAEQADNFIALSWNYMELSDLYFNRQQLKAANEWVIKAERSLREGAPANIQAKVIQRRAHLAERVKRPDIMETYYRKYYALTKDNDELSPLTHAGAARLLGRSLRMQKKYQEAERRLLEAIELSEELNASWNAGWSCRELGKVYFNWKRNDESIDMFERSIKYFSALEPSMETMGPHRDLYLVFRSLDRVSEAKEQLEHCRVILNKLGVEKADAYLDNLIDKMGVDDEETEPARDPLSNGS